MTFMAASDQETGSGDRSQNSKATCSPVCLLSAVSLIPDLLTPDYFSSSSSTFFSFLMTSGSAAWRRDRRGGPAGATTASTPGSFNCTTTASGDSSTLTPSGSVSSFTWIGSPSVRLVMSMRIDFGDRAERALDVERVQRLIEHAAAGRPSGRFAARPGP